MFNINNWKEPILKKDLRRVILYGLLFALLGGILGGALDFLFDYISVRISLSLVVLAILIGYRVSRSYNYYHILYPTLIIPFMIIGIFISYFTYFIFLVGFQNIFQTLGSGSFWYGFLILPASELVYGIQIASSKDIVLGVVNILIYILAFVSCFILANRNRNN